MEDVAADDDEPRKRDLGGIWSLGSAGASRQECEHKPKVILFARATRYVCVCVLDLG